MDKEEDKKEVARLIEDGTLVVAGAELYAGRMPPILSGHATSAMERRVERFYFSVGSVFDAWVKKQQSFHTRRAYEQDVNSLIYHLKLNWPKDSAQLLAVSVGDVMAWRDKLEAA